MIVETRLGKLFVEEQGEGEPVVLWHSFLCDGGMWRSNVPALSARYRVINIDGPGHGRSAPIRRAFTLEDCAGAALDVLDARGVDRAHWIGLSWGGMTGMRLALASPERVRSLTLLDTSAHAESRRNLPKYYALKFAGRAFGMGMPVLLDRLGPIFLSARAIEEKPELLRDLRALIAGMDNDSVMRCADAIIFGRQDIVARLGEIDAPTLVVVGSADVATPPSRSRAIADGIRGAKYLEIPGAGHLSALERPEQINDAILSFLRGIA